MLNPKKVKIKNRLGAFTLPSMLFFLFSCAPDNSIIEIKDKSSVRLVGEYGEIELKFRDSSILLSEISILDESGSLIYKQTGKENGLIEGGIRKGEDKSLDLRIFDSYFLKREKTPVNDTLIEEVYYDLYKTRELVTNGKILYLDMYRNKVKLSNVLNFRVLDHEWDGGEKMVVLIRNYFPFNGDFNFYRVNSREKLVSTKVDQNLYFVELIGDPKIDKMSFDIEILPSSSDTLVHDVFTQEINIKR